MNISKASNLLNQLADEWLKPLSDALPEDTVSRLTQFLDSAYENHRVYPPKELLFTALNKTLPQDVRVVILGQDPYHGPSQAHGLSFSVPMGTPLPPSLKNIFVEMVDDLGCEFPFSGDLTPWAERGVLLLNTTLSVEHKQPGSHFGKGWESFTDAVISHVNQLPQSVVYILWGAHAQSKKALLNNPNHLVLTSPHPSPLSVYRGFWNSKPFSKTNDYLKSKGESPIDWSLN
jgi:uracil-DNA glycosylase